MAETTISSRGSVRVLGVEVHPCTWPALKEAIVEAITERRGSIIANHNLHSLYLYHHDDAVRAFYDRAAVVHIDGMSLVVVGQLLGLPLRRAQRLTPLDWIRPLLAEAARRRCCATNFPASRSKRRTAISTRAARAQRTAPSSRR